MTLAVLADLLLKVYSLQGTAITYTMNGVPIRAPARQSIKRRSQAKTEARLSMFDIVQFVVRNMDARGAVQRESTAQGEAGPCDETHAFCDARKVVSDVMLLTRCTFCDTSFLCDRLRVRLRVHKHRRNMPYPQTL